MIHVFYYKFGSIKNNPISIGPREEVTYASHVSTIIYYSNITAITSSQQS